ncbi:MAG: hypothetical protein A2X12_01860 [Bacteroidetes bacterium GWE2_29_8]|nr:MAG: hypothetical protein A2X12_01860 [Bacteroidetes bacterium GWE2_29_8]OFY23965.1 MAG: hypothetical protein A2X02_00950 [Bacteroidetes bacterium GWF2_29_10]
MRKIIILTLFYFLITPVIYGQDKTKGKATTNKPVWTIKLKIKGLKDTLCYLGYYYGDKQFIRDTAKVNSDGVCVFEGTEPIEGGIYLAVTPDKKYFEIMVSENKISLETDTAEFVKNMKVIESKENKLFYGFLNYIATQQEKAGPIREEMKIAQTSNDTAKMRELKQKMLAVDSEVRDYKQKLMEDNPNSIVTKIFRASQDIEVPDPPILENGRPDSLFQFRYYKQHFFDNIDFSDDRILRTPIFHPKLVQYLEKLTLQQPDSINATADFIINKAKANKEMFKYCVYYMTSTYEKSKIMGFDAIFVHLVDNYFTDGQAFWVDSTTLYKIQDRAKTLKPLLIGNKAPDLTLYDTTSNVIDINEQKTLSGGKTFNMYNIPAKYMVLFYWDPDCGHCKHEIPLLINAYDSVLKDMGVVILAISLENADTKKWKEFINGKNMKFINGFDPSNQNNLYKTYDIYSTPVIYLLDQEKRILAKRISVDQIKEVIDKEEEFKREKIK